MASANISSSSSCRKASFASNSSTPKQHVVRSSGINDRRERLVRDRLRWLQGHWDGDTPPLRSPPPTAGSQSGHRRPQVAPKRSRRASQCGEKVATSSKGRLPEAANQTPGRRRQSDCLGETENVIKLTDSRESGKNRDTNHFPRKVISNGSLGDDVGVGARVDRRAVLGDPERTAATRPSEEASMLASGVTRKSTVCRDDDGHHGDTSSRAEHHALHGVASPRAMASDSDAISELSTESFTSASVDVDKRCRYCHFCHQRSNEPPSALLMAPPFVEDDDALNTRQAGARRSEIKPASPPWKHPESDVEVVDDAARILGPAPKSEGQARGSLKPSNSVPKTSIGKPPLPMSAAAPGFEFDAPAESVGAAPASWSTRRHQVGVLGMFNTVDVNDHSLNKVKVNQPISGIGSTERVPLVSNNLFDEERERSHRLLKEENAALKENLRRAEIRQAAAEATASSVLQRAKAAELSREVKEIQIRNLEIRLARYTNSDNHYREECARRRGRTRGGDFAGNFRRQDPLLGVEEAPPPCENTDRGYAPAAATTTDNSTAFVEPVVREARSLRARNYVVDGAGAGGEWGERLRKFEVCFRRNCVVLGARVARAGEGAVAVVEAAAAANRAPKETTVLRAAAVEGGEQAQADNDNQAKTDRDMINEYWGSDYCVSV